jgi:membrane protein
MARLKSIFEMLKAAFADWSEDNAPRLGAALSYYTLFSLGPLLLIATAVAGLIFGPEAAHGRLSAEIQGLVGDGAAEAIEGMIRSANKPRAGVLATVIGLVTLALGATGVFTELRSALNAIWEVPPPPKTGLLGAVRERVASFAMVLAVGFLLLVSLVISAALSALGGYLGRLLPGGTVVLLQVLNVVVSLVVITVLFALLFKMLPDVKVAWRDVWLGAAVTACLFTIGKTLIGLYLGHSAVASAYGAAGSLVVVLVWIYYAAQILFYGAELTQVFANRHGSRALAPKGKAGAATEAEDRAKERDEAEDRADDRGKARRQGKAGREDVRKGVPSPVPRARAAEES